MKGFEDHNPIAVALYFLAVTCITMFSANPIIYFISLSGSVILYIFRTGIRNYKIHIFTVCLLATAALANMFFSHNGVTVLFVMNNNPITLEAILYGIFAGIMIVSVIYWFQSFTQIMTSDKLLYIFGRFSSKAALILSMALRYVPLFAMQIKKVNQAQKAMGLYKEDNIIDRFRGGVRIFSVMVTWTLENGIITADSMDARGYGQGKRTYFSIFKFRKADILLLSVTVILFLITLIDIMSVRFSFYPEFSLSGRAALGYISYGMLVCLPVAIDIKENLRWKYLKSKI